MMRLVETRGLSTLRLNDLKNLMRVLKGFREIDTTHCRFSGRKADILGHVETAIYGLGLGIDPSSDQNGYCQPLNPGKPQMVYRTIAPTYTPDIIKNILISEAFRGGRSPCYKVEKVLGWSKIISNVNMFSFTLDSDCVGSHKIHLRLFNIQKRVHESWETRFRVSLNGTLQSVPERRKLSYATKKALIIYPPVDLTMSTKGNFQTNSGQVIAPAPPDHYNGFTDLLIVVELVSTVPIETVTSTCSRFVVTSERLISNKQHAIDRQKKGNDTHYFRS